MVETRLLDSNDVVAFRELRLLGLRESPAAFGQTPEEFESLSDGALGEWLGPDADRLTFGAFDGGRLVGLTGLRRENRSRVRHKGIIWGVYVHPAARGQGVARRLLTAAIAGAATIEGLTVLVLSVGGPQRAARALYLSLGFEIFGNEPWALRVGDDYVAEEHLYRLL